MDRLHGDVASMVGRTPLLRLPISQSPARRFLLKVEGVNPTGSVKDRAGLHILRQALSRGDPREGMTILDASSGNMACSLALFGRQLGFASRFVVSSKLMDEKRQFPGVLRCRVAPAR